MYVELIVVYFQIIYICIYHISVCHRIIFKDKLGIQGMNQDHQGPPTGDLCKPAMDVGKQWKTPNRI